MIVDVQLGPESRRAFLEPFGFAPATIHSRSIEPRFSTYRRKKCSKFNTCRVIDTLAPCLQRPASRLNLRTEEV